MTGYLLRRIPLFRMLLWSMTTTYLSAQDTTSTPVDQAVHHQFNLGTFSIGGTDVPNVKVVYGTYGHLNPKKDNAILLPSHYMADHHGYEWLIGPGLALDTTRYFLVATELFGNGHSSSPSNTPRPFDGPRFPVATIRDNVEAVHRLLLEDVGVTHLKAIIGFSMGAEQAFQWAVSYPGFLITGDNVHRTSSPCPCGLDGDTLLSVGRAAGAEVKGCGGIMASVNA